MAEKAITWYNRLKEAINGQIKENGKREITGAKLNSVLNQMVDALGKNMTFGGVVSPATVIDNTDDNPVFYLALEAGDYPYCGNTVVGQGQIAFLFRDANNIWHQASWNAPDENFTTEEKEKLQGLPTEEQLREAFGAKANAPESKPGRDNLASFDEEGNLKDSGVSIPVPTEEEKEHVLSSGETGLEWVPKPADGDDAYGVYVKEYKEGHGGSTDGMLTRPQWLLSLKGEKGDDAVNPFKGWFDSSDDIPTQGAKKGDYAYVTTNGTSKIWKHNGTAFVNTNETVSQEQTFNSNERLSAVKIDDTHLDNPVGDDETNAPTLARAEDVMQLSAKLKEVTALETKVDLSQCTIEDGYRFFSGGIEDTGNADNKLIKIPIPSGTKRIRFRGPIVKSSSSICFCGYGFYNANDVFDNSTLISFGLFYDGYTGINTYKDYIVDIPEGAVTFVTCLSLVSWTVLESKFYCYLQQGKTVNDSLQETKSNLDTSELSDIAYTSIKDGFSIKKIVNSNPQIGPSNVYKIYVYDVSEIIGKNLLFNSEHRANADVFWLCFADSNGSSQIWSSSENSEILGLIATLLPYRGEAPNVEIPIPTNAKYLYVCLRKERSYTLKVKTTNSFGKIDKINQLNDKVWYNDLSQFESWKKNLIDVETPATPYNASTYNEAEGMISGAVWSDSVITTGTYCLMSSKLRIKDNTVFTVSNAVLYTGTSGTSYIIVSRFDKNGNFIKNSYFVAVVDHGETGGTNYHAYGHATVKYKREPNEDYCRIRLRQNENTSWWKTAQVEIGDEVTTFAPYHSEKTINQSTIASKEYVDNKLGNIEVEEVLVDNDTLSEYEEDGHVGYYSIDGTFNESFFGYKSTRIDVAGYDEVKFLGYQLKVKTAVCYGFQNADGTVLVDSLREYDSYATSNITKEYSVVIPKNAKYFVCLWKYGGESIDLSAFYCVLKKGYNVLEKIEDLERNFEINVTEDVDEYYLITGRFLNYEATAGTSMERTSTDANWAQSYRLYPVEQGETYFFSGSIKTDYNLPPYPIIYLSGETDLVEGFQGSLIKNRENVLGVQFKRLSTGKIWEYIDAKLTIPSGCQTIAINIWNNGVRQQFKLSKSVKQEISLEEIQEHIDELEKTQTNKTQLRVLAIGNSFSVDSVAYVPFLMHHFAPDVDFSIDLLMESSSTLTCQILDYLHAKHNFETENPNDKYPHVKTRTGNDSQSAEGEYMYQDGRSYLWHHYDKKSNNWQQKSDDTQAEDQNLFTIQDILLHNGMEFDIILFNSSWWNDTEGYNGGYNPNIQGFIDLIQKDLNYPVKIGCMQVGINLHSFTSAQLQWDESKIFDQNDNFIREIEYSNGKAVKYVANYFRLALGATNNLLEKSVVAFKIPINTALNNAYTWDKMRNLGSFGYLKENDSATHLSHGLPRQLAAYTVMLKLLETVGFEQIGIIGDRYMMDAVTLATKVDLTPPAGAIIGFDGEDKFENLQFIQNCAVMAVKRPEVITDMNPIRDVCYIQYNLQEIKHTPSSVSIRRGSAFSAVLTPSSFTVDSVTTTYVIGEVKVFMGGVQLQEVVESNADGTKTVTIDSVTADVIIEAQATAPMSL